jgi:hypothetical protein
MRTQLTSWIEEIQIDEEDDMDLCPLNFSDPRTFWGDPQIGEYGEYADQPNAGDYN